MVVEAQKIYCDYIVGFAEGEVHYCNSVAIHEHDGFWCRQHCTGCPTDCEEIFYIQESDVNG